VRIYWPPIAQHDDLPVVVFYHGGGWALGDLDTHDPVARAHAVAAEAIVVLVDYRLAPEHPYPQGIDDSWAALRWVGEHAAELGADPARVAVAGDSAGGNISAVMGAARPRQRRPCAGGPTALGPVDDGRHDAAVDDREPRRSDPGPERDRGVHAVVSACRHRHLRAGQTAANTGAGQHPDLSGLPPAFIGTAEYDPLRDDGARYAELLSAAGVPVDLYSAPTLVHGFVNFALVVPAAADATNRGLAALKAALQRG
jgi:acetyl esterase/lipase